MYTLENPPIPIHLIKSKSFKLTRDYFPSASIYNIGSISKGYIGHEDKRDNGLSIFERI